MDSDIERKFFEMSFVLAEEALSLNEVPVGCVFVDQNKVVIGRGLNQVNKTKNPTMHAEFVAIEEIEQWCQIKNKNFFKILSDTTLYVTLEPCIMCASALYQIGIKRIVYGASNPRFGGLGSVASNLQYQHKNFIEIVADVDTERSISLLRKFYERENIFAPLEKRKAKNKDDMGNGNE